MPIVLQDHEFAYAKTEEKASPKVHITGAGKKYRLNRAMFGYGLPEKGGKIFMKDYRYWTTAGLEK